jgi:hypothetical protein
MVMRNVNLYLDTLYSAFEMIASGVTRQFGFVPRHPVNAGALRPQLQKSVLEETRSWRKADSNP